VEIFLETERLVLRRFTEDDVDNLVELDSDPDVMHFINGGRPTPRHEIENDLLPKFIDYYAHYAGYGFWSRHREVHRAIRRLVPFPARESRRPERSRTRLPAV